jgi:hypothetical protein
MSPRTAQYVEAMMREGDNFDYDGWLKRVREEEVQAKQFSAGIRSGDVNPATIQDRTAPSDNRSPALMVKAVPVPRATRRSIFKLRDSTPNAQLRQ